LGTSIVALVADAGALNIGLYPPGLAGPGTYISAAFAEASATTLVSVKPKMPETNFMSQIPTSLCPDVTGYFK
jgi:hypothetical protein